jgi:hypothetical protein
LTWSPKAAGLLQVIFCWMPRHHQVMLFEISRYCWTLTMWSSIQIHAVGCICDMSK